MAKAKMHLGFDLSYSHMGGRWRMPGSWENANFPDVATYEDLARIEASLHRAQRHAVGVALATFSGFVLVEADAALGAKRLVVFPLVPLCVGRIRIRVLGLRKRGQADRELFPIQLYRHAPDTLGYHVVEIGRLELDRAVKLC